MLVESVNPLITKQQIQDFESDMNISLPKDYRKFLLKYNGGEPDAYVFKHNKELGSLVVNSFYGMNAKEDYEDLKKLLDVYTDRISDQFITIGDDSGGDQFVLGIKGKFRGKVYYWNHNSELENDEFQEDVLPDNMYKLADSFDEFLNKLEEDTEI